MKELVLSRGYVCWLDDLAYESFRNYRWTTVTCNCSAIREYYLACRKVKTLFGDVHYLYLHRMLAGVPRCFRIRFLDDNWLNLQSENMLIEDKKGNRYKYRVFSPESAYPFLVFDYYYGLWRAEYHKLVIGYYDNEVDGVRAYNKKMSEIYDSRYRQRGIPIMTLYGKRGNKDVE